MPKEAPPGYVPPGKVPKRIITQPMLGQYNQYSRSNLEDSPPNAIRDVSVDGLPMPWDTSIRHPLL